MGCSADFDRQVVEFRSGYGFVLIALVRGCEEEARVRDAGDNPREPAVDIPNRGALTDGDAGSGQEPTRLGIEWHRDFLRVFHAQAIDGLVGDAPPVGQLGRDEGDGVSPRVVDVAPKSPFSPIDNMRALDIRADVEGSDFFLDLAGRTLSDEAQQEARDFRYQACVGDRQDGVRERRRYGASWGGM